MEKKTEKPHKIKVHRLSAVTALIVCVAAFCSQICAFGATVSVSANSADAEDPPRVIAHAGGDVRGYSTTNSLEAVQQAVSAGHTLIELDMLITADEKIVMVHDFGSSWTVEHLGVKFKERPTEEEYLSNRIHGIFTPMSFDMLTEILDEHPNVRIVTDCKENSLELLSLISRKYPDYTGNIVPQIYDYYQCEQVKRLGYKDIIFTLYTMGYMDYDRLLSFVRDNDIFAVTVGVGYLYEDAAYRLAKDGVRVYMHPLNDFDEANALMERGIYGVYSSTLAPDEFEGTERRFYLTDPSTGKKLSDVTLPNASLAAVLSLPVRGAGSSGVWYYIDGFSLSQSMLDSMQDGIHTLTIKTPRYEEGTDYILYKGTRGLGGGSASAASGGKYLRIVEQKNAYRVQELRGYADMQAKLSSYVGLSDREKNVLMRSVVMAAGEYGYYDAGVFKEFRLSAYDVIMPRYAGAAGQKADFSAAQAQGTVGSAVIPPVKTWSGRPCINYENVLIYLPEGTVLTEKERIAVGKAAKYIFNDWNRAKEEIYATCI